jgi:hypothetical protein
LSAFTATKKRIEFRAVTHGSCCRFLLEATAYATEAEARKYAHNAGFYVTEQTGGTVQIRIPEGFTPKEW